MNFIRLRQAVKYGWIHAGQISERDFGGNKRLTLFIDILKCFLKYRMWSNQYLKHNFHKLTPQQRKLIGNQCLVDGKIRDEWQRDFQQNRKFLLKYSHKKYEIGQRREQRRKAYTKRFNCGKELLVEYDVNISRQHYLNGSIKIGDNVLFAHNVTIDYSGDVTIGDFVAFSKYSSLLSHSHDYSDMDFFAYDKKSPARQESIVIEDRVWVGENALILSCTQKIGRGAVIGAGAVCRNPIPPYAVVIGNPARIIGFRYTPEEIIEVEKIKYPEDKRLPLDLLTKNYNKYYAKKIKDIYNYLKQ